MPNGRRNHSLHQLIGHNLSLTEKLQPDMTRVVGPRKGIGCSKSIMVATSTRPKARMQVLVANGCWLSRPWDPGAWIIFADLLELNASGISDTDGWHTWLGCRYSKELRTVCTTQNYKVRELVCHLVLMLHWS